MDDNGIPESIDLKNRVSTSVPLHKACHQAYGKLCDALVEFVLVNGKSACSLCLSWTKKSEAKIVNNCLSLDVFNEVQKLFKVLKIN